MIGIAAAWLIKRGVSSKLARPLVIVAAVVALALVCATLWRCVVDDAVEQRQAEARAEIVEQAREADREAMARGYADARRLRDEREALEGITYVKPTPLTDDDRAFLRCVRLQQQARADRRPVSAC